MARGTRRSTQRKAAPFLGSWRIRETDLWDVDDLDLIEPAHITFDASGLGELQLIAIGASIDYRVSDRDGRPCVEFSWSGYDESDPATGRGWVGFESDGTLKGMLFIHQGDESAFVAHRAAEPRKQPIVASRPKPDRRPRKRPATRRRGFRRLA